MSLKNNLNVLNLNKNKHSEQVKAYQKEINDLKAKNKSLQKSLANKDSLDVTLASKDIDLAKSQADVEELKAANNNLRLCTKQKIEDKDNILQQLKKTNKRLTKLNLHTEESDAVNFSHSC